MPRKVAKSNRGPAAADDNRRALIKAARKVFASRGLHAPLSAVATEAGVGQGVLYRHFPTRLSLALAVFEKNWVEFERIALDPDPHAFERLWRLFVDKTIDDVAFVEMAVNARHTLLDYDGEERMRGMIGPSLARAQAAELISHLLTADDVLIAQRMVYGVAVTARDPKDARTRLARAWKLADLLPKLGLESAERA